MRAAFQAAATAFLFALSASPGSAADIVAPTPQAGASSAALSAAGEGRRQYLRLNCYGCHGMRAGGGMGPSIVGAELRDLTEVVNEGADRGMPSYHKYLSATDVSNIAAYLRTIGSKSEPRFDHWWEANPVR